MYAVTPTVSNQFLEFKPLSNSNSIRITDNYTPFQLEI